MLLAGALVLIAAGHDRAAAAPVPILHESALLTPPGPTHSITFGATVAFAGPEPVVSGPILGRPGLDEAQVAIFRHDGAAWEPIGPMTLLRGIEPGEIVFQVMAGAPSLIATPWRSRRHGRAEIAILAPSPGSDEWRLRERIGAPAAASRPDLDGAVVTDGRVLLAGNAGTFDLPAQDEAPLGAPSRPQVFVFTASGGAMRHVATLEPPAGRAARWFGASLALDGEWAAIGSPRAVPGIDAGITADGARWPASVFMARRDGDQWRIETEVFGRAATLLPGFGSVVALEGDLLVVRATGDTEAGAASQVFVFRRHGDEWRLEGELRPRGVIQSAAFGAAMAISGGRVLVGDSHAVPPGGEPTGLVHLFEAIGGEWRETTRLAPRATAMLRSFGAQVAVQGDRVLVNRTRSVSRGCTFGGAYLFELPPPRPDR